MTEQIDAVRETQRQLNGAALTIAQLRKENRYLRKLLTDNGRNGRILRRARDDGFTLLLWRYSGFYPSRDWCREQGMTERRWAWARALLMTARLWTDGDIVETDLAEAKRRLAATYERLRSSDDDYLLQLRRRMPRKFQYTGKRAASRDTRRAGN